MLRTLPPRTSACRVADAPGTDRAGHPADGFAGIEAGSLTPTDASSMADFSAVFHALDDCYAPVAGHARLHPLAVLLHDESGTVTGGLVGRTVYSWLIIEMLFVPAPLRDAGVASALVGMAEAAARARGCIGMQVDTFDPRARSFYQRLGFTVFGVQHDLPPGQCCFYLCRRLDLAETDVSRDCCTARHD